LPRVVPGGMDTTGFTYAEITELCERIESFPLPPECGGGRLSSDFGALTITLTCLRRNRVQAEIAEDYEYRSRR
jgi:hypothetical protein